jgi:hypothetical protein
VAEAHFVAQSLAVTHERNGAHVASFSQAVSAGSSHLAVCMHDEHAASGLAPEQSVAAHASAQAPGASQRHEANVMA